VRVCQFRHVSGRGKSSLDFAILTTGKWTGLRRDAGIPSGFPISTKEELDTSAMAW
jgi:hypothetical protein